jgi:N-acetylglucosaminyldiphosphoundecaprenol N-acetyl-beta-D-mannosaminyltransferase
VSNQRSVVLGCDVDRVDIREAMARCEGFIVSRSGAQHVSINAAKIVALRTDARLREIIRNCELVTADGMSIVWASRLLGDPLPGRVTGIDLMENLLELANERGFGVYILGARQEVLERAVSRIRKRYPRVRIAGSRNGYFAEPDNAAIVDEIRNAQPDLLFVAISSPKKEYWLAEHRQTLAVPFAMGVGGSIDVWAGVTRRAPSWMQHSGLEWLYRLAQEPRRLWKRYLVSNAIFTGVLVAAFARRVLGASRRA